MDFDPEGQTGRIYYCLSTCVCNIPTIKSCGKELLHRMDASHFQSLVGLLEGVPGMPSLLRRDLGKEGRKEGLGSKRVAKIFHGQTLGGTSEMERRSRCCRRTEKSVLRVHVRCVRKAS